MIEQLVIVLLALLSVFLLGIIAGVIGWYGAYRLTTEQGRRW